MLKFLDGPAAGVVLACSRAPHFLRVVHATDSRESEQEWDALDQLTDTPRHGEKVYVYRKTEDHGWVHYDGRDKNGRRFGRTEQCADYRLHESQPDDATLRNNAKWAGWAQAEYARTEGAEE